MFERVLDLQPVVKRKSLFLLGPRLTGKSTFLKKAFHNAHFIDLLETSRYQEFMRAPRAFSEMIEAQKKEHPIFIIDEIQRMPELLNDIHRWIELDKLIRFILTGSSARKLKKGDVNLLAGRASRLFFHPICFPELGEDRSQKWQRCVSLGGLPSVLTSDDPIADLKDYIGLYLREEIQSEGLSRSIENFSRFLDAAALCQCEQVNFTQIGSDAQVPARTIMDYFSILEDTLVGVLLPAFTKTTKRKAMTSAKFYFFDVGVGNVLAGRTSLVPGSAEFGKAFEHYVFTELRAFLDYRQRDLRLHYWRSTSKFEVDFVIPTTGKKVIAIEVKAKTHPTERDWTGLKALAEDVPLERKIVVSLGHDARKTKDGVEVLPAAVFLERLWRGEIL